MKKLLFIYNSKSGKAQIKNHLLNIIDVFAKAGYEITVHPTQFSGDAFKTAAEDNADYDLIVCSGGDGTLDEVVAGVQISNNKLPIGYIPAGSTNDFARSLSLPFNMVEAAKVSVGGNRMACDIGAFNNKTFVYVAAFGAFTEVTYQTEQELKNILGHAAYVLEGMKSLPSVRAYHMEIEYSDDKEYRVDGDYILGMVTNSLSVGGFSNLTDPKTKLDDGLFEVLLIKEPQNLIEFNGVIAGLLNRDFSSPLLETFKASKLTVSCDEAVSWTLDGEFGGSETSVKIKNLNKAVEIVVP